MKPYWFLVLLAVTGLGCSHELSSTHRTASAQERPPENNVVQDNDVPADVPAAVEQLRNYVDQLNVAIAGGKLSSAYSPLAEADSVVDRMMVIARDSGVPKCYWDRLNAARCTVHEQLEKLRDAIGTGEERDLESAKNLLDDALGSLESIALAAT
jgi:DNA/RNA-binding domain of Phe-tRNA-synthetase-like protein